MGDYPIQISHFSGAAYSSGIEEHTIDNVRIRVYSIAKTTADCFKYRNKIGLDITIEALKDIILNRRATIVEILHFAEVLQRKREHQTIYRKYCMNYYAASVLARLLNHRRKHKEDLVQFTNRIVTDSGSNL